MSNIVICLNSLWFCAPKVCRNQYSRILKRPGIWKVCGNVMILHTFKVIENLPVIILKWHFCIIKNLSGKLEMNKQQWCSLNIETWLKNLKWYGTWHKLSLSAHSSVRWLGVTVVVVIMWNTGWLDLKRMVTRHRSYRGIISSQLHCGYYRHVLWALRAI